MEYAWQQRLVHVSGALEQDARLALYRGVRDPALLKQHGLFIAEGRLVVERVVKQWPGRVRNVLVTAAAVRALASAFDVLPSACSLFVASQEQMQSLTGHRFHRGCLALVQRPPALDWEQLTRDARRLLVAVGVGNPDNMGSLFRNALAFGVEAILLANGSVDPFYRKALRTSVGAVLRVPYARLGDDTDLSRVLDSMNRAGVVSLALSTDAGAIPIFEAAPRLRGDRLALVVGAEGPGLGPSVVAHCSGALRVAMQPGIDSLNLAVASGIAMHALMPHRQPSPQTGATSGLQP